MKKLEKYTSYKDSGVEWLGEIPEHWNIEKLKSHCKAYGRIGFRGYTTSDLVSENEGAITISPSNIFEYSMIFEKCSFLSWEKYYESPEIQIEENDILIVKTGSTFGKVGMVKNLPEKATINPQLLVLKNIKIEKRFFYYILTSSIIQTQVNKQVIGSTIPTISENKILNFISLLPPKQEQTKIASYLDENTAQLDKALSQKQKLIELLKERRQITLNEAVTKGLDKAVEFKDSGIEWIGEIPKHWKLERLGSNFIERREKVSDKDFEPLSVTKNGVVPQLDSAAKSNDGDNRKLVRKGDFVINSRSDRKGSSGLSKLDGSVSLINIVLSPIEINSDFSHILLKSNGFIEEFYRNGHGIVADLWTTRFWDMKSIMLAIPTKNEQIKIVEYIETQTSKIDKAIELEQKQIAKLKEYKASLIDSVVTGKVKVS
ncbi:MAG: restriction endonuclease subunit S [Arcobacteraceae bacterium]|jgi:type I restriction enzyme S subunit|nr:restriction endonuclease subunit S [Arcobacteraceae bacterium]